MPACFAAGNKRAMALKISVLITQPWYNNLDSSCIPVSVSFLLKKLFKKEISHRGDSNSWPVGNTVPKCDVGPAVQRNRPWGRSVTSDVNFDTGFGIRDLNYIGSYALLTCICFPEMIKTNVTNVSQRSASLARTLIKKGFTLCVGRNT